MSGEDSRVRGEAPVPGASEVTRTKWYTDTLLCYRDAEEAAAVCGDCARPVCGPVADGTIRGLVRSFLGNYGHAVRFHDPTFHRYDGGTRRAVASLGLLGAALLSVVLAGAVPDVAWTAVSDLPSVPTSAATGIVPAVTLPPGLETAAVHSAVVLGLAGLVTLRYQGDERRTDARVLVRRTTDRIVCDGCFASRRLEVTLVYLATAVAVLLVTTGVVAAVARGSALPLRIAAVGLAVGLLRDDVVAYLVEGLALGGGSASAAPGPAGPDRGGQSARADGVDHDPPSTPEAGDAED